MEKTLGQNIQMLTRAARLGDMEQVTAILKETPGAAEDWQPLMTAAFEGHAAVVKLLLEHGANPDALSKNNYRHRPLHRVLEHKKTIPKGLHHVETVQVLLDFGASLTSRGGHSRMTPLCLAAVGGETQFIPLLQKYIEESDIFSASVMGDLERVREILHEDPSLTNATDENNWRPLNYCTASKLGRDDPDKAAQLESVARLLIERGADLDASPPALASAVGNPLMMTLFLKLGADPNHGLINALWQGNFDAAEQLLASGADIRRPVVDDTLSELVQYGMYRMAEFLVDRGANINAVDDHRGRTPLHWAAVRGASSKFVQYLVDHGADPKKRDSGELTPLDLAKEKGRSKLVELLSVPE